MNFSQAHDDVQAALERPDSASAFTEMLSDIGGAPPALFDLAHAIEPAANEVGRRLAEMLTEFPPRNVRAYYFGLAEPESQEGEWLYISGASTYDEDTFDWAALNDDSYLPSNPDLPSWLISKAIDTIRSSGGSRRLESAAGLFLASALVRSACGSHAPLLAADSVTGIPVIVGWDNGDALRLGVATSSGFVRD